NLRVGTENPVTRKAQVTDGLSNTIILIEMAGRPDKYLMGVSQGFFSGQGPIWVGEQGGGNIIRDSAYPTCAINCNNTQHPYSFHTGGCNSTFADGSVQFINQNVDMGLLCALGTPDGGEVTGADY